MDTIRALKRRPWLTTGVGVAALAMLLLLIPISYDHTVGHEVTLGITGSDIDQERAGEISKALGAVLGTEEVTVNEARTAAASLTSRYEVSARISNAVRSQVEQIAASFAASLAGQGIQTKTSVAPIVESVTGNVYEAAASSLVTIRINTQTMSEGEIAEQIRTQLEEAGIYDSDIDVTIDGDCCKIAVRVEGGGEGDLPEFMCETEMETSGQAAARIMIHRTPDMTDADVIAQVERQLAEQGVSGAVTIDENGQIQVEIEECE